MAKKIAGDRCNIKFNSLGDAILDFFRAGTAMMVVLYLFLLLSAAVMTQSHENALLTTPSARLSYAASATDARLPTSKRIPGVTSFQTTPSGAHPCTLERVSDGLKADCAGKGLTDVPTNLPGDVTRLDLNGNSIPVLRKHSFVGLSALKVLSLTSSGVRTIQKGTLSPLLHLESISLDDNHISSLPGGAFSENHKLSIIQLTSNNLTSVPVHAFGSFESPVTIIMFDNNINHLNFTGFPTINATELVFTANAISCIRSEDLSGLSTSHIGSFELAHNNLTTLADGVFQHLNFVKSVDLSYNALSNLTFDSFLGMDHLQSLYIENSKVKRIVGFTPNTTLHNEDLRIPPLKNLTLSYNKLSDPWSSGAFEGLDQLIVLNLRECHINALSSDAFEGLVSLERIDLTGNLIESIAREMFLHLPSLQTLILTRNHFKILNPSSFAGVDALKSIDLSRNYISTFEAAIWNTTSLDVLDLSDNKIDSIDSGPFRGLRNLDQLVLSTNPILTFGRNAFEGLENLTTLDLSHLGLLQELSSPFKAMTSLLNLDLSHTPLKRITKSFQGLQSLENLDLGYTSMNNINLFKNNISTFSPTPNLKVLSLRGNTLNYMFPETFKGLPHLTSLDLSRCDISTLDPDIFQNLNSLIELHLYRNNINTLTSHHLRDLTSLLGLRLQTNQLKGIIPRDLFLNNKMLFFVAFTDNSLTGVEENTFFPMRILDISGNPLSCTCDLEWFRGYLETTNMTVNNLDKTICSPKSVSTFIGKPLLEFVPDQVCGPHITIYVSATLLIALFITGPVLAYRNRWWLNYKCFHIKLFVVGYYELEDGREHLDYNYDVCLIFPDEDEEWTRGEFIEAVQEHLPEFARERIVGGEDDLPLGGTRLDAIDYVIENSFKIIVIVSNAAVNDAHFMTQLQMAVEHMNEVQLEKVVLVFRDEVPDNQLPYLARLFLSKNKPYFQWTDNKYGQMLFWGRLTKSLKQNKKMNNLLPI